jgi:hypothetical protein
MTLSEKKTKRTHSYLWLASFIFLAAIFISWYALTDNGPHGGALKKTGEYYIEMKNPEGYFFTYLLDKKLKTLQDKSITAEVRFFMPDSTIVDLKLSPGADNSFTTKSVPGFVACKITFKAGNKEISAMFDNVDRVAELKRQ